MPPTPIVDVATLDFAKVAVDLEGIRKLNPQRYEMEQLTAILSIDTTEHLIVGYKDISSTEFWVRGHIPGRPLMPGVMMCEAVAQLASIYYRSYFKNDMFVGFGGMEDVRFRGTVEPGDRLVLAGRGESIRRRRCVFRTQGFVGARMVFHAGIIGIPV